MPVTFRQIILIMPVLRSMLKVISLGLLLWGSWQCSPTASNLSEENFKNPPMEYRPLAYWDWLNGYIDTARMVYELEQMKEKGMQGAFIWDVGAMIDPEKMVPAGPAFLGKESLEYISLALKTASRLGLNLGLITSSSWNAGGPWIDTSDATKHLVSTRQRVSGPGLQKITINIPDSEGSTAENHSLITSIAIPYLESMVIDHSGSSVFYLDEFTEKESIIAWNVPAGEWEVHSFFMSNTMQNLFVPSPNSDGLLIDHMSKRATKVHFDTIIARLASTNAPLNSLKYLEVDSYELEILTDFTPGFIDEFNLRYGYDPVPFLPLFQGYTSSDSVVAKRFRGDYSRLVSDLIIENHFHQGTEITNANGMLLFAEGGHGGTSRVDPLKAMGQVDVPMGEFWNRQRHWVTKEASSAAHIYGNNIVASESLTGWQHWQHGPTDYKQLSDVAFCEGLNQVVFHTFAHNPAIAGKPGFAYHAGEHINVNATWWDMSRPFMDYLSRCSYMLRQGNAVSDVLLYYGDDAPNLVPPKRIDPNYTPDMPGIFPHWFNDKTKCPHCGIPKPIDPGRLPGYDYDYVNEDIISSTLQVEDGKLTLPHGQSYGVMMLPDRMDISLEVLKSLEKLIFNGAVVIGPKPERATSLKNFPACDREVEALADKLWGKCNGKTILSNQYGKGTVYWGKSLEQVLKERKISPDFEVLGIDNYHREIDYMHRQTATEDIYFVSNSSESEKHFTAVFRVDANKSPEIWDAETGLIQRQVEFTEVENGISMDFVMDPLASRIVVFRNGKKGKNDPGLRFDLQFGFHRAEKSAPSIDLTSDWNLAFDTRMGGPKQYLMKTLTSWTDIDVDGIKYYSGTATYTRDFTLEQSVLSNETEAFVVFEGVQNMARVFINGNDCGIVWTPPYRANITPYLKAGNNKIRVEVVNTWNNRIVGDLKNPNDTPYTNSNVKSSKFKANSPLLESGLLGQAEVIFILNQF
ncbi:glycosyl hydrolase [Aquiflexum sp.]|uniref:glycosyl hydrolase n=1 Tax=Aquiflexum sp. TaxID=1872584 RepID=UPI003593DC14